MISVGMAERISSRASICVFQEEEEEKEEEEEEVEEEVEEEE